jgi:hypothetical protein
MVWQKYAGGMPKVEKVTVSLPAALFTYVENERTATGATRSETIAALLWRAKYAAELEAREEQYARAYAEQPETEDESVWILEASGDALVDRGDEWAEFAPKPNPTSHRNEKQAGGAGRTATSRKGTTRATR